MSDDVLVVEVVPEIAVEETRAQLLAPWWHTAALLAALAVFALAGRGRTAGSSSHHLALYFSSATMTWMLFGSTVAGLYDRRLFFVAALNHRARAWLAEVATGLGIYVGFFFAAAIIVGAVVAVKHDTQFMQRQAEADRNELTQSQSNDGAVPSDNSAKPDSTAKPPDPITKLFNQKTVRAMAPRTWLELLGWLVLSITAGFCEECIFRGYLLQQFLAAMRRVGASPRGAAVVAVLASSLLFGSLHVYEGIGGAALITMLGLMYAVIALVLGNLRAVIAAHFMQDFFAGLMLFALHHHR